MRITVSLSWTASTAADCAGYRVSWASGAVSIPGKTETQVTLSVELAAGTYRKFYVQAFDVAGNLSVKKAIGGAYVV